jgi:hypothetical protein
MEWQLKSIARKCAISGEPFRTGDRVVCIILKREGADIERTDMLASNAEKFTADGIELGRWTREVKDHAEEEREARLQLLATREEFFLSLFNPTDEPSEDRNVLKQLLALMLERKRILRSIGKPTDGIQRYLHIRTREEFQVPIDEFLPEQIARIQPALETLIA